MSHVNHHRGSNGRHIQHGNQWAVPGTPVIDPGPWNGRNRRDRNQQEEDQQDSGDYQIPDQSQY